MGINGIKINPLNAILAILGFILVVEGIWLVIAPQAIGMLVDGIVLFALGIWNVVVGYVAPPNFVSPQIIIILGFLQIIGGIQSFKQYRRFSGITLREPPPEAIRHMDEMVKSVVSENPKQTKEVVDFREKCFPTERRWKGRLSDDKGVFVLGDGEDILVAAKNQVSFTKKGKLPMESTLIATFQIGRRKMKGYISPESLQKYEAWTSMAAPAEHVSFFRRIPLVLWAFTVLIIIGSIVLLWVFVTLH